MLKCNSFSKSPSSDKAFERLGLALQSALVLALPDFNKTFEIKTNAFAFGIAVMLMHQSHPTAFISQTLAPRYQMLSVYENELLAILFAVKKWHYYLIDHWLCTDQQSLKYVLEQCITTPLQHTCLIKLLGFVSRLHLPEVSVNSITVSFMSPALLARIWVGWLLDVDHSRHLRQNQYGSRSPSFLWKDHLLWRKGKLVIGLDKELQTELLELLHASAVGGHSSTYATTQRVLAILYWKEDKKYIRQFIHQCHTCQANK